MREAATRRRPRHRARAAIAHRRARSAPDGIDPHVDRAANRCGDAARCIVGRGRSGHHRRHDACRTHRPASLHRLTGHARKRRRPLRVRRRGGGCARGRRTGCPVTCRRRKRHCVGEHGRRDALGRQQEGIDREWSDDGRRDDGNRAAPEPVALGAGHVRWSRSGGNAHVGGGRAGAVAELPVLPKNLAALTTRLVAKTNVDSLVRASTKLDRDARHRSDRDERRTVRRRRTSTMERTASRAHRAGAAAAFPRGAALALERERVVVRFRVDERGMST